MSQEKDSYSDDEDYSSEEEIKKSFSWKQEFIPDCELTNDISFIEIIESKKFSPGWKKWLDTNYFQFVHIAKFVDKVYQEAVICPLKRDILSFMEYTPLENISVVIQGMDPYHTVIDNKPVAHGMSFSTLDSKIPISLQNVFKEIQNEYPEYSIPENGNLEKWAKQGILLLNTALTVEQSKAGSHLRKGIWSCIIQPLLNEIVRRNPKCIFVLWGNDARKSVESFIKKDDLVTLCSAHPSGLSAHRGFFGNGHFKKINDILLSQHKDCIEW